MCLQTFLLTANGPRNKRTDQKLSNQEREVRRQSMIELDNQRAEHLNELHECGLRTKEAERRWNDEKQEIGKFRQDSQEKQQPLMRQIQNLETHNLQLQQELDKAQQAARETAGRQAQKEREEADLMEKAVNTSATKGPYNDSGLSATWTEVLQPVHATDSCRTAIFHGLADQAVFQEAHKSSSDKSQNEARSRDDLMNGGGLVSDSNGTILEQREPESVSGVQHSKECRYTEDISIVDTQTQDGEYGTGDQRPQKDSIFADETQDVRSSSPLSEAREMNSEDIHALVHDPREPVTGEKPGESHKSPDPSEVPIERVNQSQGHVANSAHKISRGQGSATHGAILVMDSSPPMVQRPMQMPNLSSEASPLARYDKKETRRLKSQPDKYQTDMPRSDTLSASDAENLPGSSRPITARKRLRADKQAPDTTITKRQKVANSTRSRGHRVKDLRSKDQCRSRSCSGSQAATNSAKGSPVTRRAERALKPSHGSSVRKGPISRESLDFR